MFQEGAETIGVLLFLGYGVSKANDPSGSPFQLVKSIYRSDSLNLVSGGAHGVPVGVENRPGSDPVRDYCPEEI